MLTVSSEGRKAIDIFTIYQHNQVAFECLIHEITRHKVEKVTEVVSFDAPVKGSTICVCQARVRLVDIGDTTVTFFVETPGSNVMAQYSHEAHTEMIRSWNMMPQRNKRGLYSVFLVGRQTGAVSEPLSRESATLIVNYSEGKVINLENSEIIVIEYMRFNLTDPSYPAIASLCNVLCSGL